MTGGFFFLVSVYLARQWSSVLLKKPLNGHQILLAISGIACLLLQDLSILMLCGLSVEEASIECVHKIEKSVNLFGFCYISCTQISRDDRYKTCFLASYYSSHK